MSEASLVRRLAWLAAPVADLVVDPDDDMLLVSLFEDPADLEYRLAPGLLVGFNRGAVDCLLTSLSFAPIAAWDRTGSAGGRLAELLLGTAVCERLDSLIAGRGGARSVSMTPVEAQRLAELWCAFVDARGPGVDTFPAGV